MARIRAGGEGGRTVPGPDWGGEQQDSARARAAEGAEQPDSARARLDLTDAGGNPKKTSKRNWFKHKQQRKLQQNS